MPDAIGGQHNMKQGQKRGELQEKIAGLIKRAGKKGITTEAIAAKLGCNRQYVRMVIRTKLASSVVREGIASAHSEPTYRMK
jgi:site-specific recombinase XerC